MTSEDDESNQQPEWIKRVRWSKTGLQLLDERINTIASLWAEGNYELSDFRPEFREAVQNSGVRPDAHTRSDHFEIYSNNIRTAAQWMALAGIMHFCHEHQLNLPEERMEALKFFERQLNAIVPAGASTHRSWIANVCEFRSQTEEASDPAHALVRRWVAGSGIRDHGDLIDQSMAISNPILKACQPNLDAPYEVADQWLKYLFVAVQGVVLRETDAYCRIAGLQSQAERTAAWRQMLDALHRSPRQQR